MASDEPTVEVRPEDALQVAQRALAKANEIARERDELADELARLHGSIADVEDETTALNLRLSDLDESRPYDALTRDDRVGMVREYLFTKAVDGRGRALEYSDIRDEVFDGEPSPSYCYKLMRLAAGARGFDHKRPASGTEKLVVNPDEARRGYAFYSENKAASEEVR